MYKLLVQNYLLCHSLKQLAEEHGVYARWDNDKTKFCLNYSQIETKDDDKLAQECRGLILRPRFFLEDDVVVGSTDIVCCPLFRFFNESQASAAQIHWKSAWVQEKRDGTLVSVSYDYHKFQWFCSTRSIPEADLPINDTKMTFTELFYKAVKETTGYDFESLTRTFLIKGNTFCFELTAPENQVVVPYSDYRITLLAVRNNETLKEWNLNEELLLGYNRIPTPELYRFEGGMETAVEKIKEFVESKDGKFFEGVVVVDKFFNRIKIKNTKYQMQNRGLDFFASKRNQLSVILDEKLDDVSDIIPDKFRPDIEELQSKVQAFFKKLHMVYEECKHIESQKEFAQTLLAKEVWSAPIFAVKANKADTIHDFVKSKKFNDSYPNTVLDAILERI